MKASIITLHTVNNYGSVMQTYATQVMFEKLGFDVEFVDYWRENNMPKEKAKRMLNSSVMKKLKPVWSLNKTTEKIAVWFLEIFVVNKKRETWKFLENHVTMTENRYYSYEELETNPPKADLYVTGSDQVWNSTWNQGIDKAYFLEYAPTGKRRIAYSASIGKNKLDTDEIGSIYKMLAKYSAISVREKSAVDILKNIGIQADLILDPTLMLTGEEWKGIEAYKQFSPAPYLLIYQLNQNPEMDRYASVLAEIKGWDVLRIGYNHSDRKKGGRCIMEPSVPEFLGLFSHAECVLTDSFHATAFSLNLGVDFISVLPPRFGTRIESILKLTETEYRLLKSYDDYSVADKKINKERVRCILDEQRKLGMDYLNKAMKL